MTSMYSKAMTNRFKRIATIMTWEANMRKWNEQRMSIVNLINAMIESDLTKTVVECVEDWLHKADSNSDEYTVLIEYLYYFNMARLDANKLNRLFRKISHNDEATYKTGKTVINRFKKAFLLIRNMGHNGNWSKSVMTEINYIESLLDSEGVISAFNYVRWGTETVKASNGSPEDMVAMFWNMYWLMHYAQHNVSKFNKIWNMLSVDL